MNYRHHSNDPSPFFYIFLIVTVLGSRLFGPQTTMDLALPELCHGSGNSANLAQCQSHALTSVEAVHCLGSHHAGSGCSVG